MNKEEILEIFSECKSKSDVCKRLGYHNNGFGIRKINTLILEYGIDIKHFDGGVSKRVKNILIKKTCPVCNNEFKTRVGIKSEKITCSHGCANTFFRSNINHPNWLEDAYITTCFHYHERKCVICEEKNVLDVHHYDKNRDNNKPENLIPMCPTHHRYIHSKFKYLVENEVEVYRNNFINKIG